MQKDLKEVFEQTKDAVTQSGTIIVKNWNRPGDIRHKGRIDLVTDTDLAVESDLKNRLSVILPEANFLAEETAAQGKLEEMTWIIDPLDGTTNFAHGFPFVAVSVALWYQGAVCFGIVYGPILGELFSAYRGQGASLNGRPITVSGTETLKQSLVATGFPYQIRDHLDHVLKNLKQVLSHAQGVRRPGSAAIDLAFTACGRYDGFYEATLKPWDTAAGWLLVEEAGGRVTQYNSNTAYVPGAETILASNGLIHDEMSSLLEV